MFGNKKQIRKDTFEDAINIVSQVHDDYKRDYLSVTNVLSAYQRGVLFGLSIAKKKLQSQKEEL